MDLTSLYTFGARENARRGDDLYEGLVRKISRSVINAEAARYLVNLLQQEDWDALLRPPALIHVVRTCCVCQEMVEDSSFSYWRGEPLQPGGMSNLESVCLRCDADGDQIGAAYCLLCNGIFKKRSHRMNNNPVCPTCYTDEVKHERKRVLSHSSKARALGRNSTLHIGQWMATLNHFDRQCAYCQAAPFAVLEHFIPSEQGGDTTVTNCVPACAGCNTRKGGRLPADPTHTMPREWLDRVGAYLESLR